MSQPIWLTPTGSLGTVPEGVFYQNNLLATTDSLPFAPTCTATTAVTNVITCTSTAGMYAGLNVVFSGNTFGGIDSTVRYFVLNVVNSTQFRITTTEFSSIPLALTTATGTMATDFKQHVYYSLIAGSLPPGIQVADNGLIEGVPSALASIQGVPLDVNRDVTNKFTIRAYTQTATGALDRIRDRTFTLTVVNTNAPVFASPSNLGIFYDGDRLNLQILIDNVGPNAPAVVSLVGGELPGEVSVSATGLISGYIRPAADITKPPGYDLTPDDVYPYDFLVAAANKNYQFTLQVTDGVNTDLKTFSFFVYNRSALDASTTQITADNAIVTADQGEERRPFIINSFPSDLGTVRGDNYYAYQFIANDYDTPDLKYAVSVNTGSGLPPGLSIDPNSGWYYGYIPDQGITKVEYSFNIVTYQAGFVGSPITCTATTFATNIITCNDTSQIGVGQPIVFTGTSFGGITASATQVYYVLTVDSDTEFTITNNLGSTTPVTLSTASGALSARLIVASDPYPFTLTISGTANAEVIWFTPADLGSIENGAISMLAIDAENVGGRALQYRLAPGAGPTQLPYPYVPGFYNQLPQGLELLPSGEISGQVSFNTFAIDLGTTTFDATQAVTRNISIQETTFDSTFTFTVNAYAELTQQALYKVDTVTVDFGGFGYSSTPGSIPVLTFNTPIGASAIQATTGNIIVTGGTITEVQVANGGSGYTSPATLVVTQGYGGTGAVFTPVMKEIGTRDVVSVNKTFSVKVKRVYNKPYQNLSIVAMPPANDRAVIASLLDDEQIFVPDYVYRLTDPYFGKSSQVTYQHAFGLAPDTLETYVSSLYENHYWKNLVLGEILTAQAIDPVSGEVVYEVVYSRIVDNLVNSAGESVNKIVNLPYAVNYNNLAETTQVYPNSLVNMRDQVIDVVGQISTKLPLWMTSKQTDGRVLGFTPAWVMCYTKPGRSQQIAYYVQTQFQGHLNAVDFKADRYVLDRAMSRNWDPTIQNWTPEPSLTTFDRYSSGDLPFIGYVDLATQLAYADVNQQTLEHIAALGGLDGAINNIDGNTIIFAKQQYYTDYSTPDLAWQSYTNLYGNNYSPETEGQYFDESYTVPGGYTYVCTNTFSGTNYVKTSTASGGTVGLHVDDPVWFSGTTFGGINSVGENNLTQIYYVTEVVNTSCFITSGTLITCDSTTYLNNNDVVWFTGTTIGGIAEYDASIEIQKYYVTKISPTTFRVSLIPGGTFVSLNTSSSVACGNFVVGNKYKIKTVGTTDFIALGASTNAVGTEFTATGTGTVTAGNFIVGKSYTISTVGTTNFVQIGASANTVGVTFTATGNGSGTGAAAQGSGDLYDVMTVNTQYFTVSTVKGGNNATLTTATGSMDLNFGNERMAIYTISVDFETRLVSLTPTQLTAQTEYVQIVRGRRFAGAQLYYASAPPPGYTLINWLPVPQSNSTETIFDGGSMAFQQPVDMYDPTDRDDKYLVFPKANILV